MLLFILQLHEDENFFQLHLILIQVYNQQMFSIHIYLMNSQALQDIVIKHLIQQIYRTKFPSVSNKVFLFYIIHLQMVQP